MIIKMIDSVTKYISYLSAFILSLLVFLVVFDATNRYLFSNGSTAIQELQWHFFDVVILFSIAYTLKHNAHVKVDIFYDKFSFKTQLLVDIFSYFFFVLPFSFLIIYIGIDFVTMSFLQNEGSSDPGGLPYRWIVKSLMPLAFIFLALQTFKELVEKIKKWNRL